MNNKLKVKITILILFILIGFIIYKFIMLQKYNVEETSINTDTIFNEKMNIKSNGINDVKFKSMLYKDYFTDYVIKEGTEFKVKYDENNKVSSFYNISKDKQYIYLLNNNSFTIFSDKKDPNFSTEKYMKDYLKNNNIKDDVDLLKYIKDNYYLKNNLFTSTNIMKSNYIINSFTQIALPEFNSITLVEGDVYGYIINAKTIREIHLLHNNDQYTITLVGKELINDEFINKLLESIVFN